jgi:microcystin-dependent protein
MDESHERLEARAGMFFQGLIAARPAASSSYERAFYLATDQNAPSGILYYCNGTAWIAVNTFNAPVAQTPGDVIAEGTAQTLARSDHKHSLPAWGVVGEVANVATAPSAGVATKFARIDHVHSIVDGAVVAGKIAVGGVSASNQIANGILVASHFGAGQVERAAIAEDQRIVIGGIVMFTGTTAPLGWLMCDGTSYATASYPALFSVIGYKYGGAGANFNVPDLRDRIPRGAATPSSTSTLAIQAGSDTVSAAALLAALPAHSHGSGTLVNGAVGDHQHSVTGTAANVDINHYHGASSDSQGNHNHTARDPGSTFMENYGSYVGAGFNLQTTGPSSGAQILTNTWTGDAGTHSHNISVGWMSHNNVHGHSVSGTALNAGGHNHSISGSTASTGGSTTLSVLPKTLTVNFIIKI